MTRINVGVEPGELDYTHLLAEHREITRIPNTIASGRANVPPNLNNLPDEFTLGEGHVRFFYNKLWYLTKRYIKVHTECMRLNYAVGFKLDSFCELLVSSGKTTSGIPYIDLFGDYTEKDSDREVTVQRIKSKNKKVSPPKYIRTELFDLPLCDAYFQRHNTHKAQRLNMFLLETVKYLEILIKVDSPSMMGMKIYDHYREWFKVSYERMQQLQSTTDRK